MASERTGASASTRPAPGRQRRGQQRTPTQLATVRELLAIPRLQLRLLAGEAGLEHPVRWAHSIELLDPGTYLRGGELVLTMGSQLADDDSCQQYVHAVLKAGGSGIGFGCSNHHSVAPAALVAACDQSDLPLLEVPLAIPFLAIIEELAERLVADRAERGRRAHRREARLLDRWSNGQGLDGLTAELHREIGLPIVITDPGGHPVSVAGSPDRSLLAARTRSLAGRAKPESRHLHSVAGGVRTDLLLVTQGSRTLGWIGTVGVAPEDEAAVLEAVHESIPIVAMGLANRVQEEIRERQLVGRLIELIRQHSAHPIVLLDRLTALGLQDGPLTATAWDVEAGRLVALLAPPALVGEVEARMYLLVHDVAGVVAAAKDLAVVGGVGSSVPLLDIARSLAEADGACAVASRRGEIATWQDLADLPAILRRVASEALEPFVRELVMPLVEQDARAATGLFETVSAYLDAGGDIPVVARRLSVHANTVRYRLARTQELTGRNPHVFEDRVALFIAFWAWRQSGRGT
jgi:PucR family transcriptional regulator, purine catabolism regulatory protein